MTTDQDDVPFHEWTSCEVHGHTRNEPGDKNCADCGEPFEP